MRVIHAFPRSATVKDLQAFLGLFTFYRQFVAKAAVIVKPLTDTLKGGKKGPTKLEWTAAMSTAFQLAKQALADACPLDHPSATAELSLATDASSTHVSGVLQQLRPGSTWRPLGFYSAKLDNAQLRYSTFDRELLTVFQGIRYFRFMLEGHQFTVYTDHRPLVGALHRISEPWRARQQRQLSFFSEYTADIQHTPGATNIVADTFSRPAAMEVNISAAPPPAMLLPVNLADLAAAQADCLDCCHGRSLSALNVMQVQLPLPSGDGGAASILVDSSSGVLRPLVPATFCCPIFEAIHSLAHPGARATRRLISSR
jgi:RNase H-like domain found in reverse transcriptase